MREPEAAARPCRPGALTGRARQWFAERDAAAYARLGDPKGVVYQNAMRGKQTSIHSAILHFAPLTFN